MLDKLSAINERYLEVEKIISSPEAMNDMQTYVRLSKEYKDLEPIVDSYKQYSNLLANISEAKEIELSDKIENMGAQMLKEEASKISPIRMVMIRRTQLIQSGVVTNDGPTLEEIIAEEESSKESTTEIEDGEGNTEHQDMIEEGINESEMEFEDSDEGIDYESMTVAELKVILKEAGKPVSGKKADLISRIME